MENKKQMGSSPPSSYSPDVFGAKESSPGAPAGVFASIFPPPQTVVGRRSSSGFIGSQQKQSFGTQAWSSKHNDPAIRSENGSCNKSKDGSVFLEERTEPCHLSSSLYYGGQDVYSQSSGNQATGSCPMSKKDRVEDDPTGNNSLDASRGNWWQGAKLWWQMMLKVHFITRMLVFQRHKDSLTIFVEFRGLKK
ncbi:hypothetical protein MLD38_017380 [Melastoma candidum]|uniref:Uncharacterized protein n=1 Tax=Melastoma candidum TaxID=119954 RepID=A0ACB9QYN1_9MYRT|nr:hypothetical protein MLD38_017380 [Melastoma candidum]